MSNETRPTKLITFLAAVIVPLVIFILGYRRILRIALLFLEEEAAHHARILLVLAIIAITALILRTIALRRGIIILPIQQVIRDSDATTRTLLVLLLTALAVLTFEYESLRYRMFSEVQYQRRALAALQRNDFATARRTCTEYLQLYPQRRDEARLADQVCVPILDFTTAAAQLAANIESTPPRAARRDQMALRVDWTLRRDALGLLHTLAGGAVATPTRPRRSTTTAAP